MCASLQNIWRSPVRKKSSEFSDIFRQENPKFSRYFRVNKLGYSFHYPAIFLFKSAVNRWENGWYSLLIGVFQQQKIALKEVFLQRQCVSFHFPRTGKCIENAWKPRVVQCSRVGQRKEIWCFLAFVSCLRRENVLLSAIHHPNAVIPTHFYEVAIRLSCEKWYLFLYSSVFYTISHLDIYKYVYYTYIMFWWGKKNCHTVSLIGSTRVCFCRKRVHISSSLSVLHCETYGVHRFGKQVLNIWKRGILHTFFWHFPTRESKVFP